MYKDVGEIKCEYTDYDLECIKENERRKTYGKLIMLEEILTLIKSLGYYGRIGTSRLDESYSYLIGGSMVNQEQIDPTKEDSVINVISGPLFHISILKDVLEVKFPIAQRDFIKHFDNSNLFMTWFKETYPKLCDLYDNPSDKSRHEQFMTLLGDGELI